MSNGTRKKVVDFKKLLVNEDDNIPIRKKISKPNNSSQNNSHKKDKNSKIGPKQRENQAKAPEKPSSKKQKTRNCKKKEQLSLLEFTDKLNEYQEEINFLKKKRNADINIEKINSFQKKNQNKVNSALNNIIDNNDNKNKNNNSKNKKFGNIKDINDNISNNKNINNDINIELNKNNSKTEIDNENSTLIIDFYKLYYHLFQSNRLDNSKPYKFVDYLIAGDNLLFNLKKDKVRFEEIKKGISIKPKNNSLINEQLLNKSIYEYLRCDFSNSLMKKVAEKINVFLMNRYINKRKEKNSVENSLIIEKKDKFTYSNFLSDKLKDNSNKSCLSFTNDTDYFKSLIYVCNKYSKYIGKKEIPEKILIESLDKNKKILENFKNSEVDCALANNIEMGYLKDLLHNKSIRKYISKKLRSFNSDMIENNEILKSLDTNNFYKIMTIIIKNKSDDDLDKLYKLFEENITLNDNIKLDKNDLKNFIILLKFLLELSLSNKIYNDINNYNINEVNVLNNISLIKEIYDNINKIQLNNRQKFNEFENNNNSITTQKNKGRNRLKIKKIKDSKNKKTETLNPNTKNNNNDIINRNNINTNENIIPNNYNTNYSEKNDYLNNINNADNKTKRKTLKNSKIISFKIPYTINNNANIGNNIIINKTSNSLFEINNKTESNKIIKVDEINRKNVMMEKAYFETYNDENNENIKEKENNRGKKRRKKNVEENKESVNNSKYDDNKINENNDNENLNNCMTFNNVIQVDKKKLNLGKYFLNKLSSGEDIFKLIIEKPKFKKLKDKELSEHSNSIDKEKENDKDKEKNDEKNPDKEINLENTNYIDANNIKNNPENKTPTRGRKKSRTKKEKKDENTAVKEEKEEKNEENEQKNKINEIKKNDKEIINNTNKEINIKKDNDTRENSSKSNKKNDLNFNEIDISQLISNIFTKNDKERNIDIIHFNNCMIQEGRPIKEITRNDLKHSPNISVKISQKSIKFPNYKSMEIEMKENNKKNNDLIFNISNYNSKFLFSTNKNNSNYETKSKIRKNKKDSFKNINIQIDRQSVEIKGGNVILNNKRDKQNEDIIKIKDYYNGI